MPPFSCVVDSFNDVFAETRGVENGGGRGLGDCFVRCQREERAPQILPRDEERM